MKGDSFMVIAAAAVAAVTTAMVAAAAAAAAACLIKLHGVTHGGPTLTSFICFIAMPTVGQRIYRLQYNSITLDLQNPGARNQRDQGVARARCNSRRPLIAVVVFRPDTVGAGAGATTRTCTNAKMLTYHYCH